MIASTWFDIVIGVDLHWEMFPAPPAPPPAGVPTPLPNPFLGMTFDPVGAVAGMAISNAIGAVMGASFKGPVLVWTAFLPTNTGTEAKNYLGVPHILIPPGFAWAPVPRTPKPMIRPNETPKPPKPVTPDGDAVVITGSKTVKVMGSNWARLGDIALSCSEPVRLPSSTIIPIPKGAPVLVGGPPTLDLLAAGLAMLRTRFIGDSLQALISRMRPGRLRSAFSHIACFLTGHPVDVASGRVLTGFTDFELPGPLPLTLRRSYISGFAARPSPVGYGWQHTLNQYVWEEPGRIVYLSDDGREIEFDTFDFPDHRMRRGDEVYAPLHRLTLRCDGDGRYRIWDVGRMELRFEPILGADPRRAYLTQIGSADGAHQITLTYDGDGRLDWCRDSAGRLIRFTHDVRGRLTAVDLPLARGRGWSTQRSYSYDEHDDLVGVTDSLGHQWGFEYFSHLLVRETDRTGLSFYFEYDGTGEDAWCTHTWGDGGLFDHVLRYDKRGRKTFVTNSRGYTTIYAMNLIGQVVEVTQPTGGVTKYEYDLCTLQRLAEIDALGNVTRYAYDERGNRVRTEQPDGTSFTSRYHERENLCVEITDAKGGTWTWRYDSAGRVIGQCDPLGHTTHFGWSRGMLDSITHSDGSVVRFAYDGAKNLSLVSSPSGAEVRVEHDGLGRLWRTWMPSGGIELRHYDAEGNVLEVVAPHGVQRCFAYDAEGNMTRASDGARKVEMRYAGFHRRVERREGARVERFIFDTEDALIGMCNEAGEMARLELDPRGLPIAEHTFDGRTLRYQRDLLGRVESVRWPSGRSSSMSYDATGRVTAVVYSDGVVHQFKYDPDDMLREASNEIGVVSFERDALGRLLRESFCHHEQTHSWVESRYRLDGARISVETSQGARQQIERDVSGHPTTLEVEAGSRWSARFDRDHRGWETARAQGGLVHQHWKRDSSGRPVERHLHSGRELIRSQFIEWDGDDRIASASDTEVGQRVFEHDDSGRLLGWRRGHEPETRRFIDRHGRVFRSQDGTDREFGAGGRLERDSGVEFEYDDDGQRIGRNGPDGTQRIDYDDRGWLRQVHGPDGTRVEFEYDVFGRRISKLVLGADGTPRSQTRWIWDGEQVIHELHEGQAPITWIHEPESWSPIVKLQGDEIRSVVTDLAGSPTDLFDVQGRRRWHMDLDVFGRATIDGPIDECPWRWAGQYADEETGLYYNRHRYYDPAAGLYLTPDPLGLAAGSRIWSYVDDPLLWIDPLGLADFIALFRGTSQGYPGSPAIQQVRRTPTSTNPAIATMFATQASQHGDGVLHIVSPSDLTGIRTGPGNVLAHLEAEVAVHALPRRVSNRATVTITVDAARQILADMGIDVPRFLRDAAALDAAIRQAPHMSNNQIRRFLRRASEQNTNPKCFR
jgi:RHS repeat-associated protein